MQKLPENLPKIPIRRAKDLPETAAVYIFFKNTTPIYIGKAINLKRRVSSYFNLNLEPKTKKMVSEAESISFIQVNSELEALLLEAKLIRAYMPRYNTLAKDDKHPLYILITKEVYPRIITVRKVDLNEGLTLAVYGPFPSSRSIYTVLRMIRRIFPYSDHKIGKRACIYSHIGLCNPCPNEILKIENLKLKIQAEHKYKSSIRNIKKILDGNIDSLQKELEKTMKKLSKSQHYEEAKTVRDQIEKLVYITRPRLPSEFYIENPNLYEDQRKKEMKELCALLVNCKLKIVNCTRIECFDVAHLSGTNATASMVTFINGEVDKNYYRHFRIKKAKGGDDYDSMREVARRRALHFDDWGKPDLIIVDGGRGQVKAFTTLIHINIVPVIGIVKHPDRLIIGDKKIKLTGAVLNLVSRIRNEAHRFARRYHHSLISKSITNAGTN
jgi:excinuclease ABC subunit C